MSYSPPSRLTSTTRFVARSAMEATKRIKRYSDVMVAPAARIEEPTQCSCRQESGHVP